MQAQLGIRRRTRLGPFAKGWRWVGEMRSPMFTAARLPDGFHRAAAEIYRRSPHASADSDL